MRLCLDQLLLREVQFPYTGDERSSSDRTLTWHPSFISNLPVRNTLSKVGPSKIKRTGCYFCKHWDLFIESCPFEPHLTNGTRASATVCRLHSLSSISQWLAESCSIIPPSHPYNRAVNSIKYVVNFYEKDVKNNFTLQ